MRKREREKINKPGYMAMLDTCGWAGTVMEIDAVKFRQ